MPYIFFGLELVIYLELAYLLYHILGDGKLTYLVIILIFSYQFFKSFKRFIYVKNRNKIIQSYRKYQKKAQEKILNESISR